MGSAVNQVSGLLQVNARVPSSITPGATVPLTIIMGSSSQTGVTMAVKKRLRRYGVGIVAGAMFE